VPPNFAELSDRELVEYARDLAYRIGALDAQIESAAARRKRTVKIIRSTILISGGLVGATVVDLLALVITVLGLWDCVEAIREDVAVMNRQHQLRRIVSNLADELSAIEAEFHRRGVDV
jgi:hypothetical protein